MTVLTGANGALRYDGSSICRIRNWSLNITRDALDITCLGETDREYVAGLRGATGSATLMYDPREGASRGLMNAIFNESTVANDRVEFVLSTSENIGISAQVLVTNVSPAVSVGEVHTVDVQFQISGPVSGRF